MACRCRICDKIASFLSLSWCAHTMLHLLHIKTTSNFRQCFGGCTRTGLSRQASSENLQTQSSFNSSMHSPFLKCSFIRLVQQLSDCLNDGLAVDFAEVTTTSIGAMFKNFLRALPDSLFPQALYNGVLIVVICHLSRNLSSIR